MAIEVNLVLPNNLRSSFLKSDFIQSGASYTTLFQSDVSSRDNNRHNLAFKFDLVDSETREPIALTRIKSLKISNDPNFDAPSTLEITNWPESPGVFSGNFNYFYNFDTEYFFQPDVITPQGEKSLISAPFGVEGGYFTVQNWPLSGTGGLSTVYFKVVLEANSEEVTYPGSYGIFDQIAWQSERPSTPGVPIVQTITDDWVGRKYNCKFRASEEPSTGRFNTGVARYLGDIIEIRKEAISSGAYNIYSTKGAATSGNSRTILPEEPATSFTVVGYNVAYNNASYATNVARIINSNLILDTSAALRGAALYTATANKITLSTTAPDFCVQAHVQMSLSDVNTSSQYCIKAYTGTFDGTSGSVDEVVVRIDIPSFASMSSTSIPASPTAHVYRLSGAYAPSTTVSKVLPLHIVPALLSGGLLELYVGNVDEHGFMQVEAYFTPDKSEHLINESFLLASTIVTNKFSDTAALGGAVSGVVTGGNGTFKCKEIAIASGRFLLGVDLGDCFNDDKSQNIWLASNTTGKNWNSLLTNGDWMYYTELTPDLIDASRSESDLGPARVITSSEITLAAPGYLNQKSVAEISCSLPTMSSRSQVTFSAETDGSASFGEYYVAFSQYPVTTHLTSLRPMITRCDPYQNELDEPIFLPTIAVCFSPIRGIYVTHRNVDNSLSTKTLSHYTPKLDGAEIWKIIVSSEPSVENGDTTSVVVVRNSEVVGRTIVGDLLPSHDKGLGFYVSLGVRSEKATVSEDSNNYKSECTFKNITIEGLDAIHPFGDDDPKSIRHFTKSSTGATLFKPMLGQLLIKGQTDDGDFDYSLNDNREIESDISSKSIIYVNAVTVGENVPKTSDCPVGILNLVDISLGDYVLYIGDKVLVKDQINKVENGIYEVKYDSLNNNYYWERWSDMGQDVVILPSNSDNEPRKIYVQMLDRWKWHANCRVATTSVVTDFNAVSTTIDGVRVKVGDRVLVCQEVTNFVAQGIYQVASINAGGATCVLTRADDLSENADLKPSIRVKVELGDTLGNTYWGFKMIAQAPPSIPFEIGITEIHIHKQPFNLTLEPCLYASNVNLPLNDLEVGPYMLNDGDRILVKSQTIQTQNGIYAARAGAWTRESDFDAAVDIFPHMSIPVKAGVVNKITRWTIDPTINDSFLVGTINMRFVKIPNLEGMTWYLDVGSTSSIVVGSDPIVFTGANYAQKISVPPMGINTALPFTGELLELKIKNKTSDFTSISFPAVRLHMYDNTSSIIGPPITDWIPSDRRLFESYVNHGGLSSKNNLVQFEMNAQPLILNANASYCLVVKLFPNMALKSSSEGLLNSGVLQTGEFADIKIVGNLYYKLFARAFERYDNTTHLAAIHSRVIADSHARVNSLASPLSKAVKVDLNAPGTEFFPERPYVLPKITPAVRSAMLTISANDDDSGVLAFRVGKENHYGMVEFTAWQPWSSYQVDGNVEYTTYLYGTWWKNSKGLETGFALSDDNVSQSIAGSTSDGSRKVWIQTMDGVGNVSESYPITLLAQGLALLDTTPPTGNLSFLSKRKGNATNSYNDHVELNGSDRVSAVKDVRFRSLKAGTARDWSSWRSYNEYVKWTIDNDTLTQQDGLKRLEAQFRDYGNNIEGESALWDAIYNSSDRNVMFINMVSWIKSGETKETLYLSGIKSEDYADLDLSDSFSKDYPDNTAYYAVSSQVGSIGRQVRVRNSDNVTVYINASPTLDFTIDGTRGLIVMNNPVEDGDVVTADIHRDYAVIYKWDGEAVLKVLDMGYYEEPAILSMCSTHSYANNIDDNYIILGGASGNIWIFNGNSVSGPVFTASESGENLPITTLVVHKFYHEDSPYIYAGTASFPRLFRALLSNSDSPNAWDSVANTGFLQEGIGDITCSCSAYNMIFLGTNNSKILRYERELINTTDRIEKEILNESYLTSNNINPFDSNNLPVSCLISTDEQVFAGIGDRPEIWNFVIAHENQPKISDLWSKQNFNRWFVNNPTPWQLYGGDNYISLSGTPNYVQVSTSVSISDPHGENGYRDLILLSSSPEGGVEMPQVHYIANTGSDWEQLISKNAPSATLQAVGLATTEYLPFLPTYNNGTAGVGATLTATIYGVLTIDGVAATLNQRILVKNQVDKTQNGVYTLTTVGDEDTFYILTRAVDIDANGDFKPNLYVNVTLGDINKSTGWLLYPTTSGSYTVGTSEIIWQKPAWAIEFEMMHHNGGNQGFQISDGYYATDVSLSTTDVTLSSGNKTKTVAFRATEIQMLSIGAAKYPASNVKKIWNFFGDDSLQDHGPYWTGQPSTTYNIIDWNTYRFVEPNANTLGIGKSEPETTATFTGTVEFLRVTPTSRYGSPRFGISNLATPIDVNSKTKVYLRLRLTNKLSNGTQPSIEYQNWSNIKIRFAWSEANYISENTAWYELDAKNTNGFELYVFEPSWNQTLRSLAIEISGLEEGDDVTRPYVDVDYLALVADELTPNFSNNLTPVRVAVEGKDVKVWLGKSEQPILNEINFLELSTSQMEIRFGKIDAAAAASMWSWGYVQFIVGGTDAQRLTWAPIRKVIYDFNLQYRFPSTGGVRCLTSYQGTTWALTDGLSTMKISDNPDDRAAKAFEYVGSLEEWRLQAPPCPRESNGQGMVRPYAALSYYGTLVVTGERSNIRYASP